MKRERFGIIESSMLPKIFLLRDDPLRLYVLLCSVARSSNGLILMRIDKLINCLGSLTYHTNRETGAGKKGLTNQKRAVRAKQIADRTKQIRSLLQQLIDAKLICQFKHRIPEVICCYLLSPDGHTRRLRKKRASYFIVPARMKEAGYFDAWVSSGRRGAHRLSGPGLRLALLVLRDHDPLSYGGVRPNQCDFSKEPSALLESTWPRELGITVPECAALLVRLCPKVMYRHAVVASIYDGHYIRETDGGPLAEDECPKTVLAVCGLVLPCMEPVRVSNHPLYSAPKNRKPHTAEVM